MKICDIIYKEEILSTELDLNLEFEKIKVDATDITQKDILIIPNSLKIPELNKGKAPLAIVCDKNATIPVGIPTIRVKNPRVALANAFYRYEKIDSGKAADDGACGTDRGCAGVRRCGCSPCTGSCQQNIQYHSAGGSCP